MIHGSLHGFWCGVTWSTRINCNVSELVRRPTTCDTPPWADEQVRCIFCYLGSALEVCWNWKDFTGWEPGTALEETSPYGNCKRCWTLQELSVMSSAWLLEPPSASNFSWLLIVDLYVLVWLLAAVSTSPQGQAFTGGVRVRYACRNCPKILKQPQSQVHRMVVH